MTEVLDYAIVAAVGAAAGAAEVIDRFRRDEPQTVFREGWTWTYVILNALAGLAALLIVRGLGLSTTKSIDPEVVRWSQVVAAGFGSVLLLRSGTLLAQTGSGRGPAVVLQRFLDLVIRKLDGSRAVTREGLLDQLETGLIFEDVRDELVASVIAMFPQSDPADRESLQRATEDIDRLSLGDTYKVRRILQALLAFAGADPVERAVATLQRHRGTNPGMQPPPAAAVPPPTASATAESGAPAEDEPQRR